MTEGTRPEGQFFKKLLFFATALLMSAAGADATGATLRVPWLTRAGAHLSIAGIAFGVVAGIALGIRAVKGRGSRRGWLLWSAGLVCFALARWVRGSAGVTPDRPLVILEILGSTLALAAIWRRRGQS